MKTTRLLAALLVSIGVISACTTTGTGGGQMSGPDAGEAPVAFQWVSKDGGITGNMTATLPGAIYTGRFFQITQ